MSALKGADPGVLTPYEEYTTVRMGGSEIRKRLSANDADGFSVLVNTSSTPRLGKLDTDLDGRSVLELTEGVGFYDG